MNLTLAPSAIICRNANIYSTHYSGKLYILDEKRQRLSEINEMGAYIWKLLRQKTTSEEIVNKIVSSFDISPGEKGKIKKEVFNFLNTLYKKNFLKVIKKE